VDYLKEFTDFALKYLPFPWAWPVVLGIFLVFLLFCLARYRWTYEGERGWKLFSSRAFLTATFFAVAIECSLTFLYVNYFGIPDTFTADQVGVLVAQIPGDKDGIHQRTYAQAIRELVKRSPELSSVSVRLLERPLSSDPDKQQAEALALGHRLHAAFVLRAIPVEGAEQIWLTVMNQGDFPKAEAYFAKIPYEQLPNLDRLELPANVVLMAQCAVAMLQYDKANYAAAIRLLTDVLRSDSLPDAAPSRSYLHFYLGTSYTADSFAEPEGALSRAIHEYDLALSDWTRDTAPILWASAMANRAIAMMFQPMNEARLQAAIESIDLAAKVFEEKRADLFLGMVHNSRSYAYRLKQTPERTSNLETAIHEADEAMKIFTRDKVPFLWARAMINRGAAYKDRVLGNHQSNVREALRSANAALGVLKPGTYSWALAINNKGVALENLEDADYATNLQGALKCFDSALEVFDRKRYPNAWSMVMLNLGNTYGRLGDPEDARRAIVFYKLSQEVRDPRQYPREWAETMLGLSNVYMIGPSSNQAEDIRQALKVARTALQYIKRDESLWLWAQFSRRVADCLAELGEHRKAIAIYDVLTTQVTTVFGKEAGSLFYNRGNSYLALSRGHDRQPLLNAISSYEQALAFVNENDQPGLWGSIMHNMGMAYLDLPERGRQHVDRAIGFFDSALRVRSRDGRPTEWATTMLSKGMALLAIGTQEDRIVAIRCFDRSLEVFTRNQYPLQWSMATRLRYKALGGNPREPRHKPIV
jgi:tetratricopeptide (TPR) repeat protein